MPKRYFLMDKVDVDLNMLRAAMMDRIGRRIDGADVVAVDHRRQSNGDVQILEKLANLTTLSDCMRNSTVLGLRARAGHSRLALGGPGNEVVSEVDAVARGGTAGVGAAGPVGVGVGRDGSPRSGRNVETDVERTLHVS